MAILSADKTSNVGGVTVNEYLLTKHNPNGIAMPSGSLEGRLIGVTIHNTDWITVASGTTPAEQYTRATVNGNMNDVRVHFYCDDVCAWQNLPLTLSGWHSADGGGDGNTRTIAIECIMSSAYNDRDKKSEDNCAKLAAAILKQYGFGINSLYTHYHWYSRKYCPAYILPHWEDFKKKVEGYLKAVIPKTELPNQMYRIRTSWGDVASQIGAYADYENAKKAWKEGYYIFDKNGTKLYPENDPEPLDNKIVSVEVRQLQRGHKGKDVEAMQSILYAKGYSCGASASDGNFGEKTEKAVINFQTDHKLTADGICGPKTWSELINR